MKSLMIVLSLLLTMLSIESLGQNGPWGPYPPPVERRSEFPRSRPMSPLSQAARIAREQAMRAWQEQRRQIEQNWEKDRQTRANYGESLRRELEAHRQAEYAERNFPNTAVAKSYRQAATQASINRARAEINYRNRVEESIRGWGVQTVPNRDQWLRQQNTARERKDSDPQQRKADLPFSRQNGPGREPRENYGRGISGYGYGRSTTPKIQDRLPETRDLNRDNKSNRDSNSNSNRSSDTNKSWRDKQREWADRKP